MRVLFLTGDIPYPTNTGARIRTFNIIRNTKAHADVTVATMTHDDTYSARLGKLTDVCHDVIHIPKPPESKLQFAQTLIGNLWHRWPVIVTRHQFPAYDDLVGRLVVSGQFDLIHCDSISLAPTVFPHRELPSLLTEHNMEAIIWERYVEEETNPAKRWYIQGQYNKVYAFEAEACRRFDAIAAVSPDDKSRLESSFAADNVSVVPNGVDVSFFAPIPETPVQPTNLVFTGSMDWRPNQDGIRWFVEAVWPKVKALESQATFTIVGRRPPADIAAFPSRDESITVTGTVDDVRPYIAAGAVYVVPLRIGGGSRLKILEALAMRKAIVSTTIGAEGLDLRPDEDLIIADRPAVMAEEIVALMRNPERAAALAACGHAMVHKTYTWPVIAEAQVAAWEDAVRRHRQRVR